MKKIIPAIGLLVSLLMIKPLQAQPFFAEIQNFRHLDSIHFPPKNSLLFIGSSSFTKWTDIQMYFQEYKIINRGFGGSTLPDLIRYLPDIVFPYQPAQVIIYCGENDLASSDSITPKIVAQRFKELFVQIRAKYPKVPVGFISIKPSPSRWQLKNKFIESNKLIRSYLRHKRKTNFINVFDQMLDTDGLPKKDIFLSDQLHMNAKGYAIWQKIIQPFLVQN